MCTSIRHDTGLAKHTGLYQQQLAARSDTAKPTAMTVMMLSYSHAATPAMTTIVAMSAVTITLVAMR